MDNPRLQITAALLMGMARRLLKMAWHRDSSDQGATAVSWTLTSPRAHAIHKHGSLMTWDNLVGTASREVSCAWCPFPLSLKPLPLPSQLLVTAALLSLEQMCWSKALHSSLGLVSFLSYRPKNLAQITFTPSWRVCPGHSEVWGP